MTITQKKKFKILWDTNGDIYDFFSLAKKIYPCLVFADWDKQWQGHVVLHSEFDEGLRQFKSAVFLAGGNMNKL